MTFITSRDDVPQRPNSPVAPTLPGYWWRNLVTFARLNVIVLRKFFAHSSFIFFLIFKYNQNHYMRNDDCNELNFPTRGSTQVLLCLFPDVLWLSHSLYSVGQHPVSSLHIYTFVVSRAFNAGLASQAGDADSSRAPDITSGLQGSVNVHRGALLLVPQWQCISSFVFYISRPSTYNGNFSYFIVGLIMQACCRSTVWPCWPYNFQGGQNSNWFDRCCSILGQTQESV